ncbi:MAG: hypothetical protein KGM16_10160 [Bacteroidota bacterium]|nr:hypothetical protein [Bacteroidota bacterium]
MKKELNKLNLGFSTLLSKKDGDNYSARIKATKYSLINSCTKFGYWAAVAAKKFRHKKIVSSTASDTIYSVASLP